MSITRCRAKIDHVHAIRNPHSLHPNDMDVFVNTLVKTRVATLYRTPGGLRGHALQIQQELNRLAKIEGCSGEVVCKAIEISKFVRHSLKKAKGNAVANNFPSSYWRPDIYYLSAA